MPIPLKKHAINSHIFLISILIFIVFISLLWSDSQSLIAHDEGLYARRAKLIYESGDWMSPFASPHHKTLAVLGNSYKFKFLESVISWVPEL